MSYSKRKLPIGKKFEKLTILEEVPTTEKCKRYVYCECECGSMKTVRYDSLKSGRIKSCGCLLSVKNETQIGKMLVTRKRNKERVITELYVGKKFDRLTIKSVYKHPKYASTWFNVKCDCGKELTVSLTRLKIGHTKSCGCIRKKFDLVFVESEIDGEKIQLGGDKSAYLRIFPSKEMLHIHEAKKAFTLVGRKWFDSYVVHHIDGNKRNNNLENLSVIDDNALHRKQHNAMEKSMYSFLVERNLLAEFYSANPNLKLETLKDITA
jgi:hypothetical protein